MPNGSFILVAARDWTALDLLGWITMAFLAVVFVGFVTAIHRHENASSRCSARRTQTLHDGRAPLDPSGVEREFGEAIPAEVARRVLRALAKVSATSFEPDEVALSPDRLRASDRLIEELGFGLDSLSALELLYEIEREFGGSWSPRDMWGEGFARSPTIGDVAHAVAAKLRRDGRVIEPGVDYRPRRGPLARLAVFFRRLFLPWP